VEEIPAILKVEGWHRGAAPTEHELFSRGNAPVLALSR